MPTCHSTNDLALELYKKNKLREGTVVIAGEQTAGRGQRGNRWESEAGKNITCSIFFQPSFLSPSDNFFLNIFASLGILDFLSRFDDKFRIKWPNDIFYKNKKICGILIENSVRGSSLHSSILGMGLNVNQTSFITPGAISLTQIVSKEFDPIALLQEISQFLEQRYLQMKSGKFDNLREDYLKNLYWINEPHQFFDWTFFEGVIVGISESGRLQIVKESGLAEYDFKEVRFIR